MVILSPLECAYDESVVSDTLIIIYKLNCFDSVTELVISRVQ